MEVRARLRYAPGSAQKMRLVADLIVRTLKARTDAARLPSAGMSTVPMAPPVSALP